MRILERNSTLHQSNTWWKRLISWILILVYHLVVFCLDVCSWLDVKGLWHVFMFYTNCVQQCIDCVWDGMQKSCNCVCDTINCFRVFCECIDEMICIDRELLNTPSVRGRIYFWSSMFSFSIFRYRFRRCKSLPFRIS